MSRKSFIAASLYGDAMADGSSWPRHVFAPSVPDGVRRQLAEDPADLGALPALLGGLLGLVFGLAAVAVLLTGAHPRGADPVIFQAVAGGGLLLVAGVALAACLRAVAHRRAVSTARARWGEQLVGETELASAADMPGMATLLRRGFLALDEIRDSAPYRAGWLDGTFDESRLREAEWRIAVEARHANRTGVASSVLTDQVELLVEARAAVQRLADELARRDADDLLARTLPTHRAHDSPGVLAAVEELIHLVHQRDQD